MTTEQVLFSLRVSAHEVTENTLLRILGDYVNELTGIKKTTARSEIYSSHVAEYYSILRVVHGDAPAPPPSPPPPPPAPTSTTTWASPTSGPEAGIAALTTEREEHLPLHVLKSACVPCETPTKCGVKDSYYCTACTNLFHSCIDFMWEKHHEHGLAKARYREALAPAWDVVAQRLRSCSMPRDLIVPCPRQGDKWGATMTRQGGLFVSFAVGGHIQRHGFAEDLLNARLVCVDGVQTRSLATATGPQATLTILVPRQSQLEVAAPESRIRVLEESAAAAWSHHEREFVTRSRAKIDKAHQSRVQIEELALERARELFHQYKVPTADGGVVPLSVYASVCLQSLDEDECIRMLYAWADRHTSSSDGDED